LKTGTLEEMGQFSPLVKTHSHTVELFVPKNLAERRYSIFLLDEDNIVVAKGRGIIGQYNMHLNCS
jgi:hypothetical protein